MRSMANEDLVQRHQTPAVRRGRLHHRALFDLRAAPRGHRQQIRYGLWWMFDEDAVEQLLRRIHADHELTREIFGSVRDEPILSDRDDNVLGLEQEPIEIGARHLRASP